MIVTKEPYVLQPNVTTCVRHLSSNLLAHVAISGSGCLRSALTVTPTPVLFSSAYPTGQHDSVRSVRSTSSLDVPSHSRCLSCRISSCEYKTAGFSRTTTFLHSARRSCRGLVLRVFSKDDVWLFGAVKKDVMLVWWFACLGGGIVSQWQAIVMDCRLVCEDCEWWEWWEWLT